MLHSREVGKVRLLQVGQMYQTSDTSPETEESIKSMFSIQQFDHSYNSLKKQGDKTDDV